MAKRKKLYIPLPLKIIDNFERRYPNVFDTNITLDLNQEEESAKKIKEYLYEKYKVINKTTANDPEKFIALQLWQQHKVVYRFDEDLAGLLLSQKEDIEVPVEIFNHMPYPCIFIQLTNNAGMFVRKTNNYLLMYNLDSKGEGGVFTLPLIKDKTISQSIEYAKRELIERMEDTFSKDVRGVFYEKVDAISKGIKEKINHIYGDRYLDIILGNLQLILYILADNKDIKEAENENIPRKENKKKERKNPQSSVSIKKWEVGYRLGATLRKMDKERKNEKEKEEEKEIVSTKASTKKRPHPRAAHYQHYWTGKRNSTERRRILKWVGPTFVNLDNYTEDVTVVREVK